MTLILPRRRALIGGFSPLSAPMRKLQPVRRTGRLP